MIKIGDWRLRLENIREFKCTKGDVYSIKLSLYDNEAFRVVEFGTVEEYQTAVEKLDNLCSVK